MEQNVCRICTKSVGKNSQELFNRKHKILLRQIVEITGVTLRNAKNLPHQICKQCHIDLEEAYEFRDRCINAQKYFASTEYKVKGKITKAKHTATEDEVEEAELLQAVKDEENFLSDLNLKSEPSNDINDDSIDEDANDDFGQIEKCYVIEEQNNTAACDGIDIEILKKTWEGEPGEVEQQVKAKAKNIETIQEGIDTSTDNENTVTVKRKSYKKRIEKKNEFICDQCGNHFTCRHHFRTHLRRHIGDKRFRCEVCPSEFYTNSELKRHMRRHTGERPFACKHCDRRFSDYSTRIKHERTHTNERPFACGQCGKAFTTTYILKNHMLVHTGERPFRCAMCNSTFTRQTHLTVHYRSITHKQNLEKEEQLKHQNDVASRNYSATM